jgi:tRNA C32,U32 (ribose-2'-O)-methylase TrmJ
LYGAALQGAPGPRGEWPRHLRNDRHAVRFHRCLAARLRFVLVAPSHPGNIGAAARALKTMGLAGLHVVQPKLPDFATHPEAVALATHGADVLAATRSHESLTQALEGVSLAFAMTGYAREFGPPLLDLRSAAALAAQEVRSGEAATSPSCSAPSARA